MKINLFPNLQTVLPFSERQHYVDGAHTRKLRVDYADTKRNGDPGTPVMRFGNMATVAAIAHAMEKRDDYSLLAEELDNMRTGKAPKIPIDPEIGAAPRGELHGQPARSAREFLVKAASGEFPELTTTEVSTMAALDDVATDMNTIPKTIDEELAQLVEQESVAQRGMRETEERTPKPTWLSPRF